MAALWSLKFGVRVFHEFIFSYKFCKCATAGARTAEKNLGFSKVSLAAGKHLLLGDGDSAKGTAGRCHASKTSIYSLGVGPQLV